MSNSAPVLHVHGPVEWHGEAMLVGNRAALLALRDACEAALRSEAAAALMFVADGEGFDLHVVLREAPPHAAAWNNRRLPYQDRVARAGTGLLPR